jgi:hypothetical protein
MSASSTGGITDKGRLLFGAGFVFGVLCTLLILMVVVAAVTGEGAQEFVNQDVFTTIAAGVCFLLIVGTAMYALAFPENRTKVLVGDRLGLRTLAQTEEAATSSDATTGDSEAQSTDDQSEKQ